MNRDEKIYEDGITWLFGHHCLECRHLTFAQHEVKELAKYFYELGYHQAEKDLTDKAKVSSGWDGFYYGQGYHQAEKDLELTYDDICEIMEIREDVLEMDSYENLYQEVLKRFKERKE
jgi:uncharacterized protein (DUF2164 family)